jgi:tRNA G18 (ribose-2'-O)-methylase SpoU
MNYPSPKRPTWLHWRPFMKVPGFDMPLEDVKASLASLRRPLSIAILRARNPFNVGAIIRVAHSFLVKQIVLVGDEPFYQRAAMGMQRYENVVYLPDEPALVTWTREQRLPMLVFEREHARVDLWRADLPEQCLMVFGSESTGVPDDLVAAADQVVAIPMYGINNSFPVTVAAGIAMAEWTRRHFVVHSVGGNP